MRPGAGLPDHTCIFGAGRLPIVPRRVRFGNLGVYVFGEATSFSLFTTFSIPSLIAPLA